MIHIILITTGYLNIVLVALYAMNCFLLFKDRPERKQKKLYHKQARLILGFHFLCNLNLILQTGEMRLLYFYGMQLFFVLMVMVFYPMIYPRASRILTYNFLFFSIVGLVMLTRLSYEDYALKQFQSIVLCFVAALILPVAMKLTKLWHNMTWIYGIGGFVLLSTVLFLGVNLNGASNWISIAGITIQPSEFAKILFVLFIACRLAKSLEFQDLIITTVFAAAYVLFLVSETDLGGALIFFMVYIVMLYVATGRLTLFVSGMLGGSLAAVVAYQLFSHVRVRVNAWRDPWSVIDTGGYQICQSLFAIGTGSWFGLGLGQGQPKSVPIVYSDFIFSALAEEMGTIFVLCILLVYVSCLILFFDASLRSKSRVYKMIALGFGVCFLFQVFLNVGGAVKFIPLTGVTLPLISYGRSSVASVWIIFGITQGICMLGVREEDDVDEETEQGLKEASEDARRTARD